MPRSPSRALRLTLLLGTGLCAVPAASQAQFSALMQGGHTAPISRGDPVTFTADQVEYDRDGGLITATGHVEAWQNDHVLRADKVTFDRATNVVAASGNVALVEPDGQTLFSDYAELTEGMREGVLRGMSSLLASNGRLVANGARRTDAKVNELSHAIYSTCNLCKTDPTAAPLWQLRAYSALQDTENKKIEYQDVWLDMFGVPVFYLPYFAHADPSVPRQSGFLVPSFGGSHHLGEFLTVPYYWVLDAQSDAVLSPTIGSAGAANLDTRYRRRFDNGTLSVDLSFGYEKGSAASSSEGYDPGGLQGALFTKGTFSYNDTWRYGFNINVASSRDYIRDYNMPDQADVLTNQIYLEGFGVGAYTRVDALAYQGLTDSVSQKALPYVLPHYQYSYFGEPDAWGGRLSVDAGAFNVYRAAGTRDQRISATGEYVRPFSDDLGQLFNVTLHVDAAAYNANLLNLQPNFTSSTSSDVARVQPQVALNYRWPFMRSDATTGTQVIEPIVQLISAPNVSNRKNSLVPNEDSLDFEFSDSNLFAFNRYSGIDRLEGGERANYALHGNWTLDGHSLDALVGESYRFHKDDTYPAGSGLAGHASDIVGRATFSPAPWLDLTTRGRLNHDSFGVRMADVVAAAGEPWLKVSAGYAYEAVSPYYYYDQATIPASYFIPRNEVTLGASSKFGNYSLNGFVRRDVRNNEFVNAGAAGSYEDECFILSAKVNRRFTSIDNDHGDTTVLFQVTFKTIGQVGFNAF